MTLKITRLTLIASALLLFAAVFTRGTSQAWAAKSADQSAKQPNFVIIFCDDLGYGDLSCFGHPTIRTPNLDRMASEGMKLTQFYSAAPVCTPSRAGIMTGRLPIRNGMCSTKRRVLFPNSAGGIQDSEITLAEQLRGVGYQTCCIGKWHLGHLPEYLPTRHGFDEFFGLPYSNDMLRPPLPLLRNEEVLTTDPDQSKLTSQYTEEAIKFIRACRQGERAEKPFFLYMPHTFPHVPLFAEKDFADQSPRGLYGDVVEALDWSVGQILQTLSELKIADNTLVVFTSDNGPWLPRQLNGGSAGLLRGGKGSTWEGGMREPTIAWWPGTVPAATISTQMAGTMDLFATFSALAGAELPTDREMDTYDLTAVLKGEGPSQRETYIYYRGVEVFAVRQGPWKMHVATQDGYGQRQPEQHDPPLLFHLEHDPSEQYNVAKNHPDVIEKMQKVLDAHKKTVKPVVNQLERTN